MSSNVCKACGKSPSTPLLPCHDCAHTHDTFSSPTPTYYCNKDCLTTDRVKHQTTCRNNIARTHLIRAGRILQDTFLLAFRYAVFDIKIKKVQKRGDVLHFFEDWYTGRVGDGPVWPFPEHLVPAGDRKGLLSHLACDDAMGYMLEMTKELLGDLTTTIEEVKFRINRPTTSFKNICHTQDGGVDTRNYGHAALVAECIDGQAYVLDLTGPQIGQMRPVVPFDEYMRIYSCRVNQVHPHGTEREDQIATRAGEQNYMYGPHHDFRTVHLQHKVHEFLLRSQKNWEKANGITLKELLGNDAEFKDGCESFVNSAKTWLVEFVDVWKKCGSRLPPHPAQSGDRTSGQRPPCTVKAGSSAYKRFWEDHAPPEQDQEANAQSLVASGVDLIWLQELRANGTKLVVLR